jgi:hypothetical protein
MGRQRIGSLENYAWSVKLFFIFSVPLAEQTVKTQDTLFCAWFAMEKTVSRC